MTLSRKYFSRATPRPSNIVNQESLKKTRRKDKPDLLPLIVYSQIIIAELEVFSCLMQQLKITETKKPSMCSAREAKTLKTATDGTT